MTMQKLRIQQHGAGDPLLLLLHGLGATGDVWQRLHQVLKDRWRGRWIMPDLPGHGGSAPLAHYSFGNLAAAVADALPPAQHIVVLGHSLGGAVALALASGGFGLPIRAVCGLGIKTAWSTEDLARAKALSIKPMPWFTSRGEAAERYLKLAGLGGLMPPEAVADAALIRDERGWSVAFDPAAFAVGAPDVAGLLGAAHVPVLLAAGERDPMCPADTLRRLRPQAIILPGLGHNAHVEDPEALWPLLQHLAGKASA